MPEPVPKGDKVDEVDTSAEDTGEAVEDMESVESEEPGATDDPFDGTEDEDEIDIDLAEVDVGEPVKEQDEVVSGEENRGIHNPPDGKTESSGADPGGGRTDSPFDGTEGGGEDPWDPPGGDSLGGEDAADALASATGEDIADILNEGFAHAGTLGLPDEFEHYGEMKTRDDLREEMKEMFEAFKLGDFGQEAAEKHLSFEAGDIDPIWGFTASLVVCAILVVQMRPDSDEIVSKMTTSFSDLRT